MFWPKRQHYAVLQGDNIVNKRLVLLHGERLPEHLALADPVDDASVAPVVVLLYHKLPCRQNPDGADELAAVADRFASFVCLRSHI